MKKHLNIIIVAFILIVFTISGYATKQDINDMAYVVAIGIDVGNNDDLKVSFQLSIPSKNTSSSDSDTSSSDSADTVIDTIECSSVESAINLANRLY